MMAEFQHFWFTQVLCHGLPVKLRNEANVCKSDSLHSLSSVSRRSQAIKCHRVSNTLDPFDSFQQILWPETQVVQEQFPVFVRRRCSTLFNQLTDSGGDYLISQSVVRYWSMLVVYPSWTQPVKGNVSPKLTAFPSWPPLVARAFAPFVHRFPPSTWRNDPDEWNVSETIYLICNRFIIIYDKYWNTPTSPISSFLESLEQLWPFEFVEIGLAPESSCNNFVFIGRYSTKSQIWTRSVGPALVVAADVLAFGPAAKK